MSKRKQSFLKGIMILLSAQVIVKILGLVYRLVITNMEGFGDIGNGLYSSGQHVYMLVLALSSVGIPSAISKLVSERIALGNSREAHRIFRIAFITFGIFGAILSAALFLFSGNIADLVGNPVIKNILFVLSPGVFFVSVSSVIRGYFNGLNDMRATSTSQVFEQLIKSILIVLFVQIASKSPLTDSSRTITLATWASAGATLAAAFNMIYLILFYTKKKHDIWQDVRKDEKKSKENNISIIKKILKISIPISLAALVGALSKNIDNFTVVNCLKVALRNSYDSVEMITSEATRLYGILTGKVDTLIGLPIALNVAFATAIVPDISAHLAEKKKDKVERRINLSLQTTLLIAIPCTIFIFVFADLILRILYPNAYSVEAVTLLKISSFSIIFILMNQTLGGIFQGLGKVGVPMLSLLIGSIIKIILNLTLIPKSGIALLGGINGAAISSLTAQFVTMFFNLGILAKNFEFNLLPKMTFLIIGNRLKTYGQEHFSIHKCKKH